MLVYILPLTALASKAIADGRHRAIVTKIKTPRKPGDGFENLWNNKTFASKVISIVWDVAQCVSKWGTFRPEYKIAAALPLTQRYLLLHTLHPRRFRRMSTLGGIFTRSNDRFSICITDPLRRVTAFSRRAPCRE
jgi:ATP-dependent DNA helicase RecQ